MINEFIKITDEDNLFYDSVKKEYRYRMHCPYCGKYSGCWCYPELDNVPMFDEDRPQTYCTDVHFVLDTDEAIEAGQEMGITVKPTMEEWNASKIVKVLIEDIDYSEITGGACSRG